MNKIPIDFSGSSAQKDGVFGLMQDYERGESAYCTENKHLNWFYGSWQGSKRSLCAI